jgi:hypothetical protein
MAMHCIGKGVRRRPRVKSTRPAVGQIGSPGALRRLPDAKASRCAPRLPGKPICSHQSASYLSETALDQIHISHAAHGLDKLRVIAILFEFIAQPGDAIVDAAVESLSVVLIRRG